MADSVIIYRESLPPFAAACGNRQTLALAVSHRDRRSTSDLHSIEKPFVRIGRSIHNDLVLPDRAVSFRHLYLQMVEGRWTYFDLHAAVRSQGRRRQASCWGWLDQVQEMNVGPYVVSPRPTSPSDRAGSSPQRDGALPEAVTEFELELLNRPNDPLRRIWRAISLIGSSRSCDLRLNDPSVSSVHASLVLTPRGVWVVDLLGRNGISVNRRRVSWKQLQNGSFLEIGRFCFRVWINNAKPLTLDKSARSLARPAAADATPHSGTLDGSLTREFVMGVLNHLVDSRTEFFEHLKQQSRLIHRLFEQLNEPRPAPLQGDLLRIERLDQELAEIKDQLTRLTEAYESTRPEPDDSPRTDGRGRRVMVDDPLAISAPESSEANGAVKTLDSRPAGRVQAPVEAIELDHSVEQPSVVGEQSSVGEKSPAPTTPDVSVQETHALLSQRMSRLAQERNSLLQSLLRHLGLA